MPSKVQRAINFVYIHEIGVVKNNMHHHLLALLLTVVMAKKEKDLIPKCNPDPLAPRVNVTILTTIPSTPSWMNETYRSHLYEIMLAFGENSRTEEVAEIRVMLDKGDSEEESNWPHVIDDAATIRLRKDILGSQKLFSKKLDIPATERQVEKISAHVFGRQPTYAELFRYASYALPGRVVVLMNADIVLRHLDRLDGDALYSPAITSSPEPPTAIALTTHEPSGAFGASCPKGKIRDRCYTHTASYDGFIFASPLVPTARYDFLEAYEPFPVYMNENGAENRAKQFLSASGYLVVDPCRNRLAEHWHCAPKMHHSKTRVDARSPIVELIGGPPRIPIAADTRGLRCPILPTEATLAIGI